MVKESVHINAPIERCFLLSTSIDLAARTSGLRPVSGKTSGNVVRGDRILWTGWMLGLPQVHQTIVTDYTCPIFFQGTMERGQFKRFQHDHHFAEVDGHTFLHDKVHFSLPLGPLGKVVGRRLVIPLIARLLRRRFSVLKQVAESEEWRNYLTERTP